MRGHDRIGLHQRAVEEYEQEDYDDYEEAASEGEDDNEQEVKPSKEEEEFLKLREQLKDKIRQKLKKQSSSAFSHLSNSQDKKRAVTNDKFGSFFGPYQPVIASRVIEESRSIRDTQHIVAKQNGRGPVSSSSTKVQTQSPDRQVKTVKEVKNKARALKDMRDYSFLLSDDADFPTTDIEQPAPRKVSAPNSDGRSVQAPSRSKMQASNAARPVSNGQRFKYSASSQHRQLKVGSLKEAPMSRPKPASALLSTKGVGVGAVKGFTPLAAPKQLAPKVNIPVRATMKTPTKSMDHPSLSKKPSSTKSNSSIQNRYPEERKATQGPDKVKMMSKQPLPSSKVQPCKQIPSREDRPKKRPAPRDNGEDDADAIQMIRSMFGYNPNRYAGNDDEDDSDMEVGFDSIMQEERRSAKIARKEDEEQLRLIEEEERRERMRKKQKMARR